MKKTLIALAVLAASGASFAQATITGNYTFGYKQTQAAGAAQQSGFGTDTAAVQFSASEDLGGGLKASAKVSIASAQRDGAVNGEDALVTLSGGFGSLTMGTVESANGLLAIGSSGAAGFGVDGNAISGSSNLDLISFSTPLTSAVTLGVSYTDGGAYAPAAAATATAVATNASASGTGLGVGTSGAGYAQSSATVGLTYRAGAVAAKLDMTSYLRENDAALALSNSQSRFRLSGAYDLGVARLSAGYSRKTTQASVAAETLVGVAVPMGAVTLGLDYGSTAYSNVVGAAVADKSGYSLGASYALSKRTNVSASYLRWNASGAADNTGFRTFVSHSF